MVRGLILALAVASSAAAQDGAAIALDLNRLDPVQDACRLTFVADNGLADLSALTLETVLFDQAGQVAALTLFDFGALPVAARRVRQFDVAGQDCASIAQVLINDVAACAGDGIAKPVCAQALRVTGSVAGTEVLQ